MVLIDSKGRLFGKFSLLDLAMAAFLFVIVLGLLIIPGQSGQSIVRAQASNKSVEVDVLVLGLNASQPEQILKAGETTSVIIRNQPYGNVKLVAVKPLPKTVTASQPDGTVKAFDDPRPESQFSNNFILTLEGKGQLTNDGPVLGNVPVKVGVPIDLEGQRYSFRASVIDVRVDG